MRTRSFGLILATALAVAVTIYVVNPLRTASQNPLTRITGFAFRRVPSSGMEPAIHVNTIVTASAWSYSRSDPAVGDIVVFQWPLDRSTEFAKRVIALGGSTVEIRDGVVLVNGRPQTEPYLGGRIFMGDYSQHLLPVHVPTNSYFLMGDNRSSSDDSRSWGAVPRSYIVGKVL